MPSQRAADKKGHGAGQPINLPGKAGVAARPWAGRARGRNQAAVVSLAIINMERWDTGSVPAVSNQL